MVTCTGPAGGVLGFGSPVPERSLVLWTTAVSSPQLVGFSAI